MESKKAIYDLIPEKFYPKTLLFSAGSSVESILAQMQQKRMDFPVIAKPDIGMQGKAVKKLSGPDDLREYAMSSKVDFLVQDFVPFEQEVGIFYYRFPGSLQGYISGIV
jgi:glutathione synthase/RimK-type ligase-like ATP-grasp enzyme